MSWAIRLDPEKKEFDVYEEITKRRITNAMSQVYLADWQRIVNNVNDIEEKINAIRTK